MRIKDSEKYYRKLAEKWLTGEITREEEEVFSRWYNQHQDEPLTVPEYIAKNEQEHHDRILQNIKTQLGEPAIGKRQLVIWYAIAASIALLLVSFAAFFIIGEPRGHQNVDSVSTDIAPGGNKALLTLSNGSVISLNDIKDGETVQQKGAQIVKAADGLLTYTVAPAQDGKVHEPQFNTITTPKGGQYQIILPDGTKVWLNAASSLSYPTSFFDYERKVELDGEGYFEVAKNDGMPFKVKTNDQEIVVLGTHFNIKAYSDDSMTKTTLLEGLVEVHPNTNISDSGGEVVLKPGEQSIVSRNNRIRVTKVNASSEVAWKSGVFSFRGADIQNVMSELSRWYDVDVEFEGELPDIKLWGEMDRNVTASEALEILRYFNLNYRIIKVGTAKKIIIS